MSRADVPRYSRISNRFWTDEKSSTWNDRVKLAALYVMTCSHRHLEGIFKLPPQYACADLNWTMKSWKSALVFLQESHFLKWDSRTSIVLIINALRYQAPENENQRTAAIRRIKDLPITPLLQDFCSLALDHCYRNGATGQAKVFAQQLNELLHERLGQPFNPLNLQSESQSETQPKTKAEALKSHGLHEKPKESRSVSTVGNGMQTDEGMSRIGDIISRWPHLKETDG
ncbi:MAG: hypothetical protein ABL983_16180 [Nitrospira sp.]